MFGRVTIVRAAPDRMDEGMEAIRERIVPAVRAMEGNAGAITLVDRESGKGINITLWESEEAMRATRQSADEVRRQAMELLGATEAPVVEEYEVAVWDV